MVWVWKKEDLMDKDNIDNMIASLFTNSKDEFSSAFNAEIGERLADVITDKHIDTSGGIISPEPVPETEK